MSSILVSGITNIETTLKVNFFPVQYAPVLYPFNGIHSSVAGVGYNVTKALNVLGDDVKFLSIIGRDVLGKVANEALAANGIDNSFVLEHIDETAQSVILFDEWGRRQINVDLKNLQDQVYPEEYFSKALQNCSLAILTNVNFSRPFLSLAKQNGITIATDVHTISDVNDSFNYDFMNAADILFMSHEWLPCSPEDWVKWLWNRYKASIIVIGLGEQGALLSIRNSYYIKRFPAVQVRPIVNTVGAGDALFAAFVHFYNKNESPSVALRKAILFASYKIGEINASSGFLTEHELENMYLRMF